MLDVRTLGTFSVSDGINVLNDDILRSEMLKKLMVYILLHRDRPVSAQVLLEALWEEDETDNPIGALKNLMYRLRRALKATFGDQKFILTSPGAYSWNPEIEAELDIERFERYIKSARNNKNEKMVIENYEKALQLYQGDFMDNVLDEHWAVAAATYYRSLHLSATKELADLYMLTGRYQDMEYVCMNGLKFDHVDEQLHCNYIISLIRQDKFELAVQSFDAATKVLYETLGIRNTGRILAVQEELLKMNKGVTEESIETIYKDMREDEKPIGVYMCGYSVFREIYRLEARKTERLDAPEYVMLVTVELNQNMKNDNERMTRFIMKQAVKHLEESLKDTLRTCDVAARYSDRQFVVLLSGSTYESSVAAAKRITSKFERINKGTKVVLKFDYERIDVAMKQGVM